ncbi:MAG: hypothetical protein EOM20_05450 [Spartobacteria bacterium]|nr:hypothetical protein [Spartobacteria bacterium]
MTKGRCIKLAIALAWILAMAWLVRYEAFPQWFVRSMDGYRDLLADGPLLMDSWMRVVFNDQQIGYSHTTMEMPEDDPDARYMLDNETVLDMNILGEMQRLRITANASLNGDYKLQRFRFGLSTDSKYMFRLDGYRVMGDIFEVVTDSPAGRREINVELPEDVIIHSPMLELSMSRMKPGEELTVRTLDPSTLGIIDVMVKAQRYEEIEHAGATIRTLVLSSEYQGTEMLTWLNDEGRLIRQQTPFGWMMEACTPEEAVAYSVDENDTDMLTAMAVPARGIIRTPRETTLLEVQLDDIRIPVEELASDRQVIIAHETNRVTMRLVQQQWPEDHVRAALPAAAQAYLKPSAFIQSDARLIKRQAERIVKQETDRAVRARLIGEWVYKHIEKDPTTSLPSALDVLKTMRGDCNEHTWLFTALARAAGVPARVCLGVVYMDGAFYYHAWPAVYLDDWIEMDPTLGQLTADATHIRLVEGEFVTQLKLMSVMGKLNIKILKSEP